MVLISTKCLYFSFFFLSCFTCMVLISTKCSTLRSTCARTAASTNAHSSEETAITGLYFFFSFVFSLHIHERTFVRRDCYYWSLIFLFFFFLYKSTNAHSSKRLLLLVSIFSFLFLFSLHIHERTFVRRDLRVSKKETHLYPWKKKGPTYMRQKRPTNIGIPEVC